MPENPLLPVTYVNRLAAEAGLGKILVISPQHFSTNDLAIDFVQKLVEQNALETYGIAAASQAEAEAGTLETLRGFSPLRISQAIMALAPGALASTLTGYATTAALALKAPLASPTFTGTPTAPTAGPGTNTTQLATAEFVQQEIAAGIASLVKLKGAINCSANPDYPAAVVGDAYRVSVAGKIGGGSGPSVSVGDTIICYAVSAAGNHATVGSNWNIEEGNIPGITSFGTNLLTASNSSGAIRMIEISAANVVSFVTPAAVRSFLSLGTIALESADLFVRHTDWNRPWYLNDGVLQAAISIPSTPAGWDGSTGSAPFGVTSLNEADIFTITYSDDGGSTPQTWTFEFDQSDDGVAVGNIAVPSSAVGSADDFNQWLADNLSTVTGGLVEALNNGADNVTIRSTGSGSNYTLSLFLAWVPGDLFNTTGNDGGTSGGVHTVDISGYQPDKTSIIEALVIRWDGGGTSFLGPIELGYDNMGTFVPIFSVAIAEFVTEKEERIIWPNTEGLIDWQVDTGNPELDGRNLIHKGISDMPLVLRFNGGADYVDGEALFTFTARGQFVPNALISWP